MPDCSCLSGGMRHTDYDRTELGMDARFADVAIHRCKACGRRWLHYHLEEEGISKSGRWYCGLLQEGEAATAENAATLFEWMEGYFAGGSYYDGKVHRTSGKPA